MRPEPQLGQPRTLDKRGRFNGAPVESDRLTHHRTWPNRPPRVRWPRVPRPKFAQACPLVGTSEENPPVLGIRMARRRATARRHFMSEVDQSVGPGYRRTPRRQGFQVSPRPPVGRRLASRPGPQIGRGRSSPRRPARSRCWPGARPLRRAVSRSGRAHTVNRSTRTPFRTVDPFAASQPRPSPCLALDQRSRLPTNGVVHRHRLPPRLPVPGRSALVHRNVAGPLTPRTTIRLWRQNDQING